MPQKCSGQLGFSGFAEFDAEAHKRLNSLRALASPREILESALFEGQDFLRNLISSQDWCALGAIHTLLTFVGAQEDIYRRDVVAPEETAGSEIDHAVDCVSWVVRVLEDIDDLEEPATASPGHGVNVMTIHAAKGLEYAAVFLPNMSSGKFPVQSNKPKIVQPDGLCSYSDADAQLHEESCLFFVALSRAKDHLILSRAERYGGSPSVKAPSPLLRLIESGLGEIGCKLQVCKETPQESSRTMTKPASRFGVVATDRARLDLYNICPRLYYYAGQHPDLLENRKSACEMLARLVECVEFWVTNETAAGKTPTEIEIRAQVRRSLLNLSGRSMAGIYDDLIISQAEAILQTSASTKQPARVADSEGMSLASSQRRHRAITGIAGGNFDPAPVDRAFCKTCTFRFVCPE